MTGNPRIQIVICEDLFQRAHTRARQLGVTTSAWLRGLLMNSQERLPILQTRQLSVRLDTTHLGRLDRIAARSKTSRSRVFAFLIERALEPGPDTSRIARPVQPPPDTRPAIPAPDAYGEWAALVLQAAHDTPHKFGERKAFIAGVLDELQTRLRPRDPARFRAMLKRLLPELNQRDLVQLVRADLIPAMDPELVADSEIQHSLATFHFVDLTRHLPDPWGR